MKKKLKQKLRMFLIGVSFPILFSSGCEKTEKAARIFSPIHLACIDADMLRNEFFKSYFTSSDLENTVMEILLSDEEIAEIISLSQTISECDYQWDGNVENLKEKIKDNSVCFLEKNDEFESAFCDYMSDYDLFYIQVEFETAFDRAIDDFVAHASGNINEDLCKFQTLNVVFGEIPDHSSTLGYYQDDTNTIVLCYQSIMDAYQYVNDTFSNFLTHILSHEFNHVRQLICEDRLQKGQQYKDICYKEDVLSFAIEASAESALYNTNDISFDETSTIYSYPVERKYEALFFLFAICNEKAEIKDYYNAIFDTDLDELYEFLGCETKEDVYDFYRIWSSIDASLGRNPDLVNLDSSIETVGEAEKFVGYTYKIILFHHILLDMMNYTNSNSDFSLEDNLTLFKIVRTVLLSDSYTISRGVSGELDRIYDDEFVSLFKNSEDMYYMFLSSYYQTDHLEISQIEENYVNGVMDAVNTFCVDKQKKYSYFSEVTSLLDRFSLLEPIFKATNVSHYDYDAFVEHNSIVYGKKR